MAFERLKAKKEADSEEVVEPVVEQPIVEPEETEPEVAPEVQEASEPQVETDENSEIKRLDGETDKEFALRLEVKRLRAERREARKLDLVKGVDAEQEEGTTVTKAEAVLYNAFQQEAWDEFLKAHPVYEKSDEAYNQFLDELNDRVNIVEYASKKGVAITKSLIKKRLESIHQAIGVDMTEAKEEGKKEILKAQTAAKIAGASNALGEKRNDGEVKTRKRILPKRQTGLRSWINK